MTADGNRPADRTAEPRGPGPWALGFGLLGGPVAWVAHIGASYLLLPIVCENRMEWFLHALTGVTAAVAAAALIVAWRALRKTRGWHGFLALTGVLLAAFYLALIVIEGLPVLLQEDPCGPVPTLDRPIIQAPQQSPLHLAMVLPGARGSPQAAPIGPDELWRAWNPDPWLLAALYLLSLSYLLGVRRLWRRAGAGRGIRTWHACAYLAGVGALVLALVSPVDAVSEALFSVHMAQHMLLMVVAPPLIVLGRPGLGHLWSLGEGGRRRVAAWWRANELARRSWAVLAHPVTILALHVGALWVWHVPRLYHAALADPWLHHLQHATFFFSAMLFWWALLEAGRRGRRPGHGAAILYVFATALQSGALGALLLFAPAPWYPGHAEGAARWGMDLLVDQQVAGALMWIPAGLAYTAAGLALFLVWIGRADRADDRRDRHGWDQLPVGRPG